MSGEATAPNRAIATRASFIDRISIYPALVALFLPRVGVVGVMWIFAVLY